MTGSELITAPCLDRIVMVGTGPKTMGGVATVIQGYSDAGLFERVPLTYVITHIDGTASQKFGAAIRGYIRVIRILFEGESIAFHVHLASRASFWRKLPIFWLSRLTRRPYIIHLHGAEFMTFYHQEAGSIAKRLIRFAFDRATYVIALSPEWKEHIATFTRNPNIRVVPNGVPVTETCPIRDPRKKSVGILFLGRLGRRKGIYDLLISLKDLRSNCIKFRLVAAGDGETAEVKAEADRLGLADLVHVPGWIGADEKHKLLAENDIFVLPSHAEGLPMSLLEAMAAGMPVICTTVGGIPLAVTNEMEGLLVPPANPIALRTALLRMIEDTYFRAACGRRAHARAKSDFSVENCVNRVIEIYAEMGVVTT